jgi:hypothetical protein
MKLVKPGLNLSPVILLGTVLILAAGCSESVQQGQQQSGSDNNKQNQGVVKSVEVAGGYTYALVDVGGDEFWLATAVTEVQPGAEVAWRDYAMMKNFKSKSLNREFDQILFVDRLVNPSAATAQNHQGIVEESMEAAGYSFIRVYGWRRLPSRSRSVNRYDGVVADRCVISPVVHSIAYSTK